MTPLLAAGALALVRTAAQPGAGTPIDHDLPLIALLVGVWAWASRDSVWSGAIEMAVPLLAIALLAVGDDDRVRLAGFGIIAASAFALAVMHTRPGIAERCALLISGIVLLRWMPLASVEIGREVVVILGTTLIFAALGGFDACRRNAFPLILIAALGVSLVTPIHPGRALLFPLVMALLLAVTRSRSLALLFCGVAFVLAYAGRATKAPLFVASGIALLILVVITKRTDGSEGEPAPPGALRLVIGGVGLALLSLWPWSGVIARALPLVPRYEPPGEQQKVGYALAASESATIEVPAHVRHLVVTASGANAARMRPGRLLGRIEAMSDARIVCERSIRIGDVADFGFDRPSQFFASRNSYPRRSGWVVQGYGMGAWVDGGGRVSLRCPRDIASLRLTAASDLPPDARLQIDFIEISPR